MRVIKSGRTSGVTEGTVLDVNADAKVTYSNGFAAQFTDQIMTTLMGSFGDSGSAVLNKQNNAVVGLLFAGSDSVTTINKIQNVVDNLDITIVGVVGPSVTQAGLGILMLPLIGTGIYYYLKGGS